MIGSDIFIFSVFGLLVLTRLYYLFHLRRPHPGGRKIRPWLQWVQLGTFFAVIALSAGEYLYFRRPLLWPLIWGVLALIAATQALKIWAITELGRYWSAHIEIHNPHPLKKTGPYAWMRNPSYLNGIVEGLCMPLISSSWFTLMFAIVSIAIVFSLRIASEEKAMSNADEMSDGKLLKDEYQKYCKNVGRFSSWRFFYSMLFVFGPLLCILAGIWLFYDLGGSRYNYHPIVGPAIVGPVKDHPSLIPIHQLLYEGICIVGVSVTILTAGMAIAAPLYLSAWQGMSDSLFDLHRQIREMLRDETSAFTIAMTERLHEHCRMLERTIADFESRVSNARRRLQATLIFSFVLLALTIVLIAIPREELLYVGLVIITGLSIAVGLMVIHLIFEITIVGPGPIKLTVQSEITRMYECIDNHRSPPV